MSDCGLGLQVHPSFIPLEDALNLLGQEQCDEGRVGHAHLAHDDSLCSGGLAPIQGRVQVKELLQRLMEIACNRRRRHVSRAIFHKPESTGHIFLGHFPKFTFSLSFAFLGEGLWCGVKRVSGEESEW